MDITQLTLPELRELNDKVVGRIKYLLSIKAEHVKNDLYVGMKVCFDNNQGVETYGVISKINRKRAKIRVNSYAHIPSLKPNYVTWNVPFSCIRAAS